MEDGDDATTPRGTLETFDEWLLLFFGARCMGHRLTGRHNNWKIKHQDNEALQKKKSRGKNECGTKMMVVCAKEWGEIICVLLHLYVEHATIDAKMHSGNWESHRET